MNFSALLLLLLFCGSIGQSASQFEASIWEIDLQEDFPTIDFDPNRTNQQVILQYDGPVLNSDRSVEATLFLDDCQRKPFLLAKSVFANITNTTDDGQLRVTVEIDQETVTRSRYFTEIDTAEGRISFCLRLDYFYQGIGLNFHETVINVDVNLSANFTISVETDKVVATRNVASASLDYPIIAYFCDDSNAELDDFPVLTQGDILQVCVQIDEDQVQSNVYVKDILNLRLEQDQLDTVFVTNPIVDTVEDAVTANICAFGICNIRMLLVSQWFVEPEPDNISLIGIALLAFGVPGAAGDTQDASNRRLVGGDVQQEFRT